MNLSLPIAFLSGLLSFLSPCVLPLVGTYLLYLGGERGKALRNAIPFVLGFSMVFTLLALPFSLLGGLLYGHRETLSRLGGVVLVLLGAYMLGLRPRWGGLGLRFQGDTTRPLGAFLLGMALGISWTPCIGPILGGILTLTATGQGGLSLLLAYLLGLALPFLLVSAFAERILPWLRRMHRLSHAVEIGAGLLLVLLGVLLLTGTFGLVNGFFLRITPKWLQELL